MKAIGYVRVSTEEQAGQGVSLEAQRDRIRSYAQLYDIEITGFCTDEGASGSTLERPGLARALMWMKGGKADALIVAKLDRLTRSLPHLLHLIEEYFGEEYSLLSVGEQLDPRTASGRLVMNILGAVAQWELETIRERTRAALAHKRAKGEYTGGGVPYGFKMVDGMLLKDEDEQKTIGLARGLRQEGWSYRKIAAELAHWNRLTRGRTAWSAQQIKRIVEGG